MLYDKWSVAVEWCFNIMLSVALFVISNGGAHNGGGTLMLTTVDAGARLGVGMATGLGAIILPDLRYGFTTLAFRFLLSPCLSLRLATISIVFKILHTITSAGKSLR